MSFWHELERPFKQIGSEIGREDVQIQGMMPNWFGGRFKQYMAPAFNPLSPMVGGRGIGDYYEMRQQGDSPTAARQKATGDIGISAAILAAIFGGEAAYGAYGAGGAGGGSAGLGGGTFSGALGESSTVPAFSSAAPSVGGTGTASFGSGYLGAGEAAVPSIGGTGSASFGSGAGFDWSGLLNNARQGYNYYNRGKSVYNMLSGGDRQASSPTGSAVSPGGFLPRAAQDEFRPINPDPQAGMDIIQQLLSNPTVLAALQRSAWAQQPRQQA